MVYLCGLDADLLRVINILGEPQLWIRQPGFSTLVQIILEQQVSLASGRAVYNRLVNAAHTLIPEAMLSFNDVELKSLGFSRQKTGYCRNLAQEIIDGKLNLNSLENLSDSEVRARLLRLKGVGNWTTDIYLLMALCRADVLPQGDLALISAMRDIKGLSEMPSQLTFQEIGEHWKPWRSVAARILWQYYLSKHSHK